MKARRLPQLFVTSLFVSSCAVAGTGEFSPLAESDIPLSLSQAATTTVATTTTTTTEPDLDTTQMVNELVDLYFILGGGLLKVQTNVVSPASPVQALSLLGAGPLDDPSYAGLRTAIRRHSKPTSNWHAESPRCPLPNRSFVHSRHPTSDWRSPKSSPRSRPDQELDK